MSIKNNWLKLQSGLDAVDAWVKENNIILDNCFDLTFRGEDTKFFPQGVALNSTKVIKDLGIYVIDQ